MCSMWKSLFRITWDTACPFKQCAMHVLLTDHFFKTQRSLCSIISVSRILINQFSKFEVSLLSFFLRSCKISRVFRAAFYQQSNQNTLDWLQRETKHKCLCVQNKILKLLVISKQD